MSLLSTALLLLVGSALAADDAQPATALESGAVQTTDADRWTVEGRVRVAADAAVVRALVRDPHATARAAGDEDLALEVLGPDGECRLVRWTIPHPVMTVAYVGRMCPTATGVAITLVESDDMAEYQSTWDVIEADGGGVDLALRVKSRPRLPLPAAMVRSQARKGLADSLSRIKASLEGGGAP